MRRIAGLVLVGVLGACRAGGEAAMAPPIDVVEEPTLGVGTPADFEGVRLGASPVAAVRVLATAVRGRSEAAHAWLAAPQEAPSPAVAEEIRRELAALAAWDRAGVALETGCVNIDLEVAAAVHALHGALAHRAFATAETIHALLRFGHALAAPGNALAAVALGTAVSLAVASKVGAEHAPALAALGPRPERLVEAARRDLACTIGLARTIGPATVAAEPGSGDIEPLDADWTQQRVQRARTARGLSNAPGWLAREWRAYAQFWSDTETRAAAATSLAALGALYTERAATAAAHPDSMLVQMLGEMLFGRQAETLAALDEQVALYAQLAARR